MKTNEQFLFILALLIIIVFLLSGMITSSIIKSRDAQKQFCQEKGMVYGVGGGRSFGACYKIQDSVVVEVKDIIKLDGKYYLK